jgi:hypothetical protein
MGTVPPGVASGSPDYLNTGTTLQRAIPHPTKNSSLRTALRGNNDRAGQFDWLQPEAQAREFGQESPGRTGIGIRPCRIDAYWNAPDESEIGFEVRGVD